MHPFPEEPVRDGSHRAQPVALTRRLIHLFRSQHYQPPTLPSVALELLQLNSKPDVEFGDVHRVLERDNVLAGHVLKIAQSPVYASRSPIRSLQEALIRLGLQTLTDLFVSVSMKMRMFRCKAYARPMDQVRLHCAATAHLARVVAMESGPTDGCAFLGGLLHDVGAAAALLVLADVKKGEPVPDFDKAWPAVLQIHERTSAWLCGVWQLPSEVQEAVAAHHGEPQSRSGATIALAEALAIELDFAPLDEGDAPAADAAISVLGLSSAAVDRIKKKAEGVAELLG